MGCKERNSSWDIIGMRNGSTIELTVSYREETRRHTVCTLTESPCGTPIQRHTPTLNKNEIG